MLKDKYGTGARIYDFLKLLSGTAYAEPPSDLHTNITRAVWERIKPQMELPASAEILDIGCGSGIALDMFTAEGNKVTGLTCVEDEFLNVLGRHPGTLLMDMHEIGLMNGMFHLVWCRHAAEHSAIPSFLIKEIAQALKPGGYVYLEVPGPDTSSNHEYNIDHKSVMGASMWRSLLERSGFAIQDQLAVQFNTALGSDVYYGWLARKAVETL